MKKTAHTKAGPRHVELSKAELRKLRNLAHEGYRALNRAQYWLGAKDGGLKHPAHAKLSQAIRAAYDAAESLR